MTPLAFLISGALAWTHYETLGRIVTPGVTVWIAWYGLVLAALCYEAGQSRRPAIIASACVMLASFVAAHVIWKASAWPIATHSLKNIVVAVALLFIAYSFSNRSIFIAGCIHISIIAVGFAADFGLIFEGRRPMQFIAWSFPDVSAGLQHAALLVISLGTREREKSAVGLYSGYGDRRGALGMARMAVHPRQSGAD